MKSIAICTVLLALFQGNVFASGGSAAQHKIANGNGKTSPNPPKSNADNSSYSGRIVNGYSGHIECFPFLVSLRVNNSGACGASIITYRHAFTAAHCLYNNQNPASITLYGGSTSQSKGGVVFHANRIIIHPYYSPETHDYDAGIVEIKKSFHGYRNIAPIALQDAEVPGDTWCYAAGWGLTNYDTQTTPDNVQYGYLRVVTPQQCSAVWNSYATPQVICAQQNSFGDVCHGDSGGPFVCNNKLTGATSFGGVGCRGLYPSVFTKVKAPAIREFIRINAGI